MKHRLKAAEGSKLLKATLAREFPGTKFSVRMSRGTAYGSIDIRYENGPSFEDVDAIASGFEGKSFDGSIDLEYHKETSYCPVHGARFAGTTGTAGSMGHVTPTGLPELGETSTLCCEKGYLCDFGLGYIHVQRELTVEAQAFLVDAFNTRQGHQELVMEVVEHTFGNEVHQYVQIYREGLAKHDGAGYEYTEYRRKADLRDPSKLLREARAYREERLAYYAKMDAERKAKQAAELLEIAKKEVRGERKEFRLNYLGHSKPILN